MNIERISIELTNRCDKACHFCYNHSQPNGQTRWEAEQVIAFVQDCAQNGIKAVSFGGGEPLLYKGLHQVLHALQGVLFRSITSNGLLLTEPAQFERLVLAAPDKVHISIHCPSNQNEVTRVIKTVQDLASAGIASGINLLVPVDQLPAAQQAAEQIHDAGIDNQRIVFLPQRSNNTPTPKQIAIVAKHPFQSMTCLSQCAPSPRFCAISWDQHVAWCSYTRSRHPLPSLTYQGLLQAMDGLDLQNCAQTQRVTIGEIEYV